MAAGVTFCIATILIRERVRGKVRGKVRHDPEDREEEVGLCVAPAGVIVAADEAVQFGRFSTSGRYPTFIV